jgi:hypothetical protein
MDFYNNPYVLAAFSTLAGLGTVLGFRNARKSPSFGTLIGSLMTTVVLGAGLTGLITKLMTGYVYNPNSTTILAGMAIAAVIALISYFTAPKDNALDTSNGDVPWYKNFPVRNIVTIGGITALAGISLGLNGYGYIGHNIPTAQFPQLTSSLRNLTANDPLNTVFVKPGEGLNGDDEAVFITPNQADPSQGYTVHTVSLKANMTMTSPANPADSNKPFFVVSNGTIQINPDISLPELIVMANTANAPGLSATSKVGALKLAAAQGHEVN